MNLLYIISFIHDDGGNAIEKLTSESAPLSAPGHVNETNSWHLLWTTKLQTEINEKCNKLINILYYSSDHYIMSM
jgi:hypothetical protein